MSSDLNFRIVLVPQEEVNSNKKDQLLSRVKYTVENCGLVVVSINYSQVKKSEEEDYPEIEGLILDVQARSRTRYSVQKVQLYKDFCTKWKTCFYSLPCSYIEFYGNDSFVNSKCFHHMLSWQKIAFGVLPHNGMFHQLTSLQPETRDTVHFFHDTRSVVIKYKYISKSAYFEMHFSYDNIRNIFLNIDSSPCEVYFDLFNPPIIFRIGGRYEMKYRNLNFSAVRNTRDRFDLSRFLQNVSFANSGAIDLSRLQQSVSSESPGVIDTDILGRANVLCFSFNDRNTVQEVISRIHYHCSEKSVFFSCISPVTKSKPPDPEITGIDFDSTYLLTAMFKRNFTVVSQSSDIHYDLQKVRLLSAQNPDSLEKALTTILAALDSGKMLNYWHAIKKQFDFYTTNRDEIHFRDYIVPSKCCMIRRITLTPTRQLFWPKEIMFGNRVLRNFDAEYAVRVSFREDNMSRLSYNASHADPGVLNACIKNPMTSGIYIGARKYEFLAWSNSQIRDHGVWMYARDKDGNTAARIRDWMGDFSHIRNVPKFMARMGQCFSQTEDALKVPLRPELVRTENDIEGGYDPVSYKPYCFSDGIGRISLKLADRVHKALGHDKLCSAFQIRYGGYKGMLVTDPTLLDADIVFRKSMKKFDCPNSDRLEIATTSAPSTLQLNRPFITLLNGLGVRHRVFLRLQEDMLKTLIDMLFEEKEAAQFLRSKTPSNLYNYEDLSHSGIHLTTEPFFKSLLLALHRHHIENLKLRANISIDPNKGRNMLGVLDETGILDYGQVFVQYTNDVTYGETTRDTTILTGEVLVTKNPCMHPGDVRKFRAVNVSRLHHIVDCIVFPKRGPRPHPNEMAGSDLDGDVYSVLWAPELIFYDRNQTPAHFPSANSVDVPYITVEHMITFLQEYIKNDQVGIIANAHLAQADNEGIFSDVCKSIADKFSIAVDFAKNGQTQQLDKEERPQVYPDFMEKPHKEVRKSKMALGKLYRVCKDFESENEVTSISHQNITVDPDLVYEGWQNYKDNAVTARNKYNALFRSVLRNYGIQHEAEALSGAFTNLHCRFHERKDRNEIEKVIIGCIKKLNKSLEEEFMEEFMSSGDIASNERKIFQKASAWYIMTYSDPNAKFLSFAWTVSKHLVNIKLRRTLGNSPPFSPIIMNLEQKILDCEAEGFLPRYVETRIWNDYIIECDPGIFRRALQTMIIWGKEEGIIERPGHSDGLLFLDVFTKLFFFVSESIGYVTQRNRLPSVVTKPYSAAHLCLEFLKYCSTLRFYNQYEIDKVLPFRVYKYSKLAKRAIVSYHTFALSGAFQTLNFDDKVKQEIIQMKPIHIESKIFPNQPIHNETLKKARDALIKYSKVQELGLREITQTKKVCVYAEGSEQAIKDLKSILRKKHVFLRQLFNTGIMPQD